MSPATLQPVPAGRGLMREEEFEKIYLHAVSGAEPYALGVIGAPQAGTSELLRRVFDRLFTEQRFVVPFRFVFDARDTDARDAASRYIYEFILQTVAFRRRDAGLIAASPDICELKRLAPLSDAAWVERLCEECGDSGPLNDDRAFFRSALAAPVRAAAAGNFTVCAILDDLHRAPESFMAELAAVVSSARMPFVLGTRRRSRRHLDLGRTVHIGPLSVERAAHVIDEIADEAGVRISEQPRDLLAVQTEGRLGFARAVVLAARDAGRDIADYRTLQQLYSGSVIAGRIGASMDDVFELAAADPQVRRRLIGQLDAESASGGAGFTLSALRDRTGLGQADMARLVDVLEAEEIIEVDGETARLGPGVLLRDYLRARAGSASSPSIVAGRLIAEALKRAPRLMSREYRRGAAVGLLDALADFDLQEVPRALLDYRVFRERLREGDEDAALPAVMADTDRITLPQISHAAPIADYLPEFADVTEPERAVLARGFSSLAYTDEDEIVWLAAEIDSKLEADEDAAREWCDRLESAARGLGFARFRIWLVAPEGFSRGALDHLAYRNAFGSSRRQAELLARRLKEVPEAADEGLKVYEMTIPVGDQTELIAAHALEEISRRYDYPPKAVNQMKTALVEACINAAEHGLTPDGKIHQKFAVGGRKVVITVSNRGLRLSDRIASGTAERSELGEGRRGWGLNLIRGLMDDVRVEPVEDGTRIVMTKIIPTN